MPARDIMEFYIDEKRVSRLNKTYDEWVFDATDNEWEHCHNHIQYLFPNTHSSVNAPAAYMTHLEFQNIFQCSDLLQGKMQLAFERFLAFLGFSGLRVYNDKGKIHGTQHNTLRISRVLRALRLAGLDELSFKFLSKLLRMIRGNEIRVLPITEQEWKEACLGEQWRFSSTDECIIECSNRLD
jgi:hypothetical protein